MDSSLCLSEGHAAATKYPLGALAGEATFIRHRIADRLASEATIMFAAQAAIWSKGGGNYFRKAVEKLTHGD